MRRTGRGQAEQGDRPTGRLGRAEQELDLGIGTKGGGRHPAGRSGGRHRVAQREVADRRQQASPVRLGTGRTGPGPGAGPLETAAGVEPARRVDGGGGHVPRLAGSQRGGREPRRLGLARAGVRPG